ncbi:disulfide reductase, partial [bacterium]
MIGYYPGCTLKTVASIFDRTAREVFRELGV